MIKMIIMIIIIVIMMCVLNPVQYKNKENHLPIVLEHTYTNPVDIVITWVDSSDIKWQESKQYYYNDTTSDNDELRFPDVNYPDLELETTIKFIMKNITWYRTIFIVTSDGQIPNCYYRLNNMKNNIKIIHHSKIWPKDMLYTLPTFNSHAIECNIHRIENLSNNFIYFNDDMYIVKKLKYIDMFYGDKMVIQPLETKQPRDCPKVWHKVWKNMYNMYNMYSPHHVCYTLNKNVMYDAERSIYQHWRKTIKNRFRSIGDVAPIGYTINFAIKNGFGYFTNNPLKIIAHHNGKNVFKCPKNTKATIICINETSNIYESIKSLKETYLHV